MYIISILVQFGWTAGRINVSVKQPFGMYNLNSPDFPLFIKKKKRIKILGFSKGLDMVD
jgi:hypothetical protein